MRAIITVNGSDRVGIIYHVTKVLMDYQMNVIDVSQTIMAGDLFIMMMLVERENIQKDIPAVAEELTALGQELGVSIRIQRQEVFQAMHNI